jgi:solute carrier family 25 phosphate transporter 3
LTIAYGKPKSKLSPGEASTLNLGSGLIAGFAAAIISQPADTLLSKINKTKALPGETVTGRLVKMSRQLGVSGLFTGLGARYVFFETGSFERSVLVSDIAVTIFFSCTGSLFMVGTLTAGQCEYNHQVTG